jgi:hypothetical protein
MKVAMVLRALSVLAILGISPQGASARTFLVVPGQSIQAAIDSSASGDTVSVAAGAYTESLDLKGKNILLAGAGPGLTILTGAPGDAVVTFQSGETNACTLTGFTITGGEGHPFPTYRLGGGLYTMTLNRASSTTRSAAMERLGMAQMLLSMLAGSTVKDTHTVLAGAR